MVVAERLILDECGTLFSFHGVNGFFTCEADQQVAINIHVVGFVVGVCGANIKNGPRANIKNGLRANIKNGLTRSIRSGIRDRGKWQTRTAPASKHPLDVAYRVSQGRAMGGSV